MKISLITVFSCVALVLSAQGEDLFPEIKNQLILPFITADEIPTVGFMAEEAMEFAESDKERQDLIKLSESYPDITEKIQNLLGSDSELLSEEYKLNAFGKFSLNNIQYVVVIETSIDARTGFPNESLVLIAYSKDGYYYDELYLKSSNTYEEFDNDGNSIFQSTMTSSTLEKKEGTLFITTKEEYNKEFIGETETEILEQNTTVNHLKFMPVDNYFELFLIEN